MTATEYPYDDLEPFDPEELLTGYQAPTFAEIADQADGQRDEK